MRNYVLNEKNHIYLNTGTDGYQEKYLRSNYWYKVDKVVGEGFVEHLVSLILRNSTLPTSTYVYYERCLINSKQGCRSKSFVNNGESFVTCRRLAELMGNNDLEGTLRSIGTTKERYDYLVNLCNIATRVDTRPYLNSVLLLDMLIENRDRHMSNVGVIYNRYTNTYKRAPIFDNGLSLGLGIPLEEKSASRTISGSYVDQVVSALGYPIRSTFKIDYNGLYRELYELEGAYPHIINKLDKNLTEYKNIFKK